LIGPVGPDDPLVWPHIGRMTSFGSPEADRLRRVTTVLQARSVELQRIVDPRCAHHQLYAGWQKLTRFRPGATWLGQLIATSASRHLATACGQKVERPCAFRL